MNLIADESVDFGIINILRQKHINPLIAGIEENGKNEKYNKPDCKQQAADPNALPSALCPLQNRQAYNFTAKK